VTNIGPVPLATRVRGLFSAVKRRPRLLWTLKVLVGVAVVGLCAYGVKSEWAKAGPRLQDADARYFGLALAAIAAYYLVFILGWIRILAGWNVHVSYGVALQAEMVSMLAKYVPGGVWTPAARVAALGRLTGETNTAAVLASILVEAVLSAISGIVVFVVSLAWVKGVNAPLEPLILFALACAAVLHPRIFRPLAARILRPFGVTSLEPMPFATMVGLLLFYCGTWVIGGFGLYFLIRSVGEFPPISTVPFLGGTAAVGAIVGVLAVFAPSGLGVREASMYGLLIAITSKSAALGATILNRLAITLVELALFGIGVAAWRLRRRSRSDRAELGPTPAGPGGSTGRMH
jgi:glycosyltransferase 2 family protein